MPLDCPEKPGTYRYLADASSAAPTGRATGIYVRNPGHGPVRDNFARLEEPDHWLRWLPDTPARSVRGQLQDLLASQVEGSVLDWVKTTEEPVFLTAGVRSPADPQRLIIRRASLAVIFEHSDKQLAPQRAEADERLKLRFERAEELEQRSEAIAVQVVGFRVESGAEVVSEPNNPTGQPVIIVINKGKYAITRLDVRISPDGRSIISLPRGVTRWQPSSRAVLCRPTPARTAGPA